MAGPRTSRLCVSCQRVCTANDRQAKEKRVCLREPSLSGAQPSHGRNTLHRMLMGTV